MGTIALALLLGRRHVTRRKTGQLLFWHRDHAKMDDIRGEQASGVRASLSQIDRKVSLRCQRWHLVEHVASKPTVISLVNNKM